MRTFERHKTLGEVRAQCAAQGLLLNDVLYCRNESDYVAVEGGGARVLYSDFNGRFFGTCPDGTEFSVDSAKHEDEPWFQALRAFFYSSDPAEVAA